MDQGGRVRIGRIGSHASLAFVVASCRNRAVEGSKMKYGAEIVGVGLAAFLALMGAAFAADDLFRAHMWVLFFVLVGCDPGHVAQHQLCACRRTRRRPFALSGRADPLRRDRHHVLGRGRASRRRGRRPAAFLSRSQYRALVQLWPDAAAAHLGGHLRVRRQRADCHLLLRRPAHLARAPVRRRSRLVRVLGLPALHRHGGHRLSARHHPEPANMPSRNGMSICG